jgi:hypothetical protein
MGWGRYLLGDIGQQLDIEDQREALERLRQHVHAGHRRETSLEERLNALQEENDQLKLYVTALVRMLVAKKIATPDEVSELVRAIDGEDGLEDGALRGPIEPLQP